MRVGRTAVCWKHHYSTYW